jgi:hypothetical protein
MTPLQVLGVALLLALPLPCVLLSVACEPRCLKSHTEPKWVPDGTTLQPVYEFDYWQMTWAWRLRSVPVPAHWTMVTVCDQYELEKGPVK